METTDKTPRKSDSEEEDYESFFLQPATSPYNIKEKLQEANRALMEENTEKTEKQFKVKFRETLADYEPDLTDDDVDSIESYENEIPQPHPEELTYILQTNQMCNIPEEIEDDEIIEEINAEEINEEIIEELKEELTEELNEEIIETPKEIPVKEIREKPIPQKTKIHRKTYPVHIDCRNHCIQELESRLDLCISKLHINDKPVCPTLKLQRRKCCEENRSQQKLPLYTGSRSEYGLSASQLNRREKRREIIKLQQQKRFQVQQEYRKRRIEQNEDIFKQWLKEISERKNKNLKTRPQTANYQNSFRVIKGKRPNSCVIVNIPESVLEKGLVVGGVVVGRSKLIDRQIEMITLS